MGAGSVRGAGASFVGFVGAVEHVVDAFGVGPPESDPVEVYIHRPEDVLGAPLQVLRRPDCDVGAGRGGRILSLSPSLSPSLSSPAASPRPGDFS